MRQVLRETGASPVRETGGGSIPCVRQVLRETGASPVRETDGGSNTCVRPVLFETSEWERTVPNAKRLSLGRRLLVGASGQAPASSSGKNSIGRRV